MPQRSRRFAPTLVAALTTAALALPLSHAVADKSFTFTRFDGQNRYDTARKLATGAGSGFSNVADVVVATGENFPDALAGNYLAGAIGSPLLLTQRDTVPIETNSALVTLQAKRVTLLGGAAAISDAVKANLEGRGYTVRRVAGGDRYATALAAAKEGALATPVGTAGGKRTAFLATGEKFADALAAGPGAFAGHLPILLTASGSLSPQAQQGISDLKIEQVVILGGTGAVSSTVETQVKALVPGGSVTRIPGIDRTETAALVANWEAENLGFGKTHVNLSRGDAFADALAGGPHAGREKAPVLLSATNNALDTSANANAGYLGANAGTLVDGDIFGGVAAVSAAVEEAAMAAAGAAPPEAANGTYTSVKVGSVANADDYFVSADGRRFDYDAGDTYRYNGTAMANGMAAFEAMLNPDDILDVVYNSAGVSTFDVKNDVVHATAAPNARYTPPSGASITVSVTYPTNNSPGTTYTVQRLLVFPGCGGQVITQDNAPAGSAPQGVKTETQSSVGGKTVTFTDTPSNPGCYTYRVVAKSPAPSTAALAISGYSGQLQFPPGPTDTDFTAPTITSAALTTDTVPANSAGKGDVHTFTFSEVMAASTAASGASYRLVDNDGTVIEIVCGTNATCALDNNNFDPQTHAQFSKLTVTLSATPSASGGSTTGFPYTSGGQPSRIGGTSGWRDAKGNDVDLSASADTTIP